MDWPIEELSIVELYLDQNNIRTPILEKDQNILIRDMFINEHAFELVKSFVQNGLFPDEFPIGIKENEKVIIIEGNRRLAALKALNEPGIVPTWQNKIKELSNPKIERIKVTIAPNREAALKHIANKHTVDYKRPWKPIRQAYFYQTQLDNGKSLDDLVNEFPDHDIPRFIKILEMYHLAKSMNIDAALELKVQDDRNFPITNLERFYNDRNVTDFLGIEFNPFGKVKGNIPKDEFEKGFKKIVEDVAESIIDSRKYNTRKERQKYLDELNEKHRPDLSKVGEFTTDDFIQVPFTVDAVDTYEKSKKQIVKSKPKPKGLFFERDVPFRLSNTALRFIYKELKDINVAQFPNATHDLLRSFLECSIIFYLKETNQYNQVQKNSKHNPTLSEMLSFIASDKCTTITDANIIQAINQIKSEQDKIYSLTRMNMINHNENWISTENEVRVAWSRIESLVKVLINFPR